MKWSMRNNINMQQSAILFAMNFVANNKERFLQQLLSQEQTLGR